MKVQLYHFSRVKKRGPMGVFEEERMVPCDTDSVSHAGKEYKAGDDGWIDVPTHVYEEIRNMHHRHPASGYMKWCTPNDVDEPIALDLAEAPKPRRRAAAKT